jgi:hypothetical protein
MKYISWDVGVKNMAYSILEKTENNECKLLRCGIINLVDKRDVCEFELRTKKSCGKIARNKIQTQDLKEISVCKAHCEKIKVISTKCDTKTCIKCSAKSTITILNRDEWSWCEKHGNLSKKVLTQFKPKKISGQNCSQQPIQELITELTNKLDANKDFIDVSGVWIENQPSLINPAIKTIASALYTYFIIRGIIDKKENKIEFVKFASPLNKLKISKETTKNALDKAKSDREYYSIEKGLSIIYVKALLSDTEKVLLNDAIVANNNKGDDICDSYLQGFHHIFEGIIPESYQEKIKSISEDELQIKKIKSKKNNNKITDDNIDNIDNIENKNLDNNKKTLKKRK